MLTFPVLVNSLSFEISKRQTTLKMNNYVSICPFFLVLYPYMSAKMKLTTRNLNVLLIFWLLFSLFMAGCGAESDIYCLQTIKKLDPFNNLSSWDLESNTEGGICKFNGVECRNQDHVEDRVISLLLSNKGLKGQFPHCIENFTWLQTLDLSHDELSGYIPSDISTKLPYLISLDLSNNYFYGEIPQELGLLPWLRDFSVANNSLEGPVPVFISNVDVSLSYANNSGLCGGALGSCDESLIGRSFWYSFIIGFVSSATTVLVAFMYYYKPLTEFKKRSSNVIHPLRKKQNHQKDTRQEAELLPLALHEQGSKELARLLERLIPRMSFMELCKATDYFSTDNVLGLGTTGIMYKAKVPNNCFLAVKRLYDADKCKRKFLLETMIPGRHSHRNIAPLLGFCIEKKERILVYKYMSNGRLSDWLHSDEGHHQTIKLEWPERIHIALGLARGLSWLHKRCKIVHLKLDSECVLLDKNFEPKISNFGKAKFLNQTVEDHVRMKLFLIDEPGVKGSAERDVYDFGMILFELITGKRLSPTTDSSDSVNDLMNRISKNLFTDPVDFYDAIDKSIIGKGFDDKILSLLEVACDCVKASLKQRPKMVDMHKTITAIYECYKPWFDSEMLELSMGCPDQITCTS